MEEIHKSEDELCITEDRHLSVPTWKSSHFSQDCGPLWESMLKYLAVQTVLHLGFDRRDYFFKIFCLRKPLQKL